MSGRLKDISYRALLAIMTGAVITAIAALFIVLLTR
jgi:hypothetical protein